jgi:trigger factor
MNVKLENIDEVTAKVIVAVEENDYSEKVVAELKQFGKTHALPGFRKGHVSIDQLRRRFGKQVKSDVLNNEVFNAVINYIRENKVNVLGEPMPVEVKEINLDDKDYTFEYEIGLAPKIDVEADKNVNLPYYEIEITDEMVSEQDKSFCDRFGSQVPGEEVDEKALVKGSLMQLNEDGTINTNEGAIQVVSSIVAPFHFKSKEEADKFLGKKVNDKVVFNPYNSCEGNEAELASMLNIDKEIAADVKGDFELSIAEIIVLKPAEHNQEFFDAVFGADKVHNEEEYTAAVKDLIAQQLTDNSNALFQYQTRESLVNKYGDMQLPATFLKKWLVARNSVSAETVDAEYEQMLPSLKWQMIKESLASKLEVKIEESDVVNYAKLIAKHQFAAYGINNIDEETLEDTAKRILKDNNYRQRIVEEVGDVKLFTVLRDAVTLDKKTVSIDEFKKIANPE